MLRVIYMFVTVTSMLLKVDACKTYSYYKGAWGQCSASCGGGTQTRKVYCQSDVTNTQVTSGCTGTAPSTTQKCNDDERRGLYLYATMSL